MKLKILLFLSRILVGITFIFSGFVKAVDPVGGAVKFNDYFQAFHLDWLMSLSMPFSIALAILEFLMGVLLVFNIFPRKTSIVSFVFMVFFTILAFFLAIFNPVSDCGCFGDAIVITNWQTFWKNIIILTFATILFLFRKQLYSPYRKSRQQLFSFLMILFTASIAIYSLRHLPLIDFRPYAVGQHIPSGMTIPDDAPSPEYKTTFILEKDGEQKEFTEDNYPYDDTTWVFIDSKSELISEGYQPPIHDFVLQHPDEGNLTDYLINLETPLFLVISPKIDKINKTQALKLAEIQQQARESGYEFYIVTSSSLNDARKLNDTNMTNFEFLQGDETNLKTIIRSNPGLLLITNGTIAGKWHYNDIPSATDLEQPLSYTLQQQETIKTRIMLFGHFFLIVLIAKFTLKTRKTINNKNQ